MGTTALTDEALIAGGDPAAFERFYLKHVETLLGFFARRTGDPELAADLTAETFAAALAGRRRIRPEAGSSSAWLYGIAMHKLTDAQRRGAAERRARRRLGMERLVLDDEDYAQIESLAEAAGATALLEELAPDQRDAVRAHVLEGRGYRDIAASLDTSETVVRKRVSRGLAAVRDRMGQRR
jgi:RNA polymerase sigma-70 factor (ECF subfamily)